MTLAHQDQHTPILQKRRLGQTDVMVSPLGLGTVKFGRNEQVKYPNQFDIPDEDALIKLLELAWRLGVHSLDTAPSYGTSEERLGRILSQFDTQPGIGSRKNWQIIGKAGEYFTQGHSHFDFSPDGIERSLHQSLERLQTGYLDVLLLHSDGRDLEILENHALIQRLDDLKSQGLILAHGISSKTKDGGLRGLELLDCVMMSYNPSYREETDVLHHAEKTGKGILLKKILASGHAPDIPTALAEAFSFQSVSTAIIGTITPAHLEQNAHLVKTESQNIKPC